MSSAFPDLTDTHRVRRRARRDPVPHSLSAPCRVLAGGALTPAGFDLRPQLITVEADGSWSRTPGDPQVDGTRDTVVLPDTVAAPALHDAHVHPYPGMNFRAFLDHGIARIRDLGSTVDTYRTVSTAPGAPVPEIVLGGPFLDRAGPPRLPMAATWNTWADVLSRLDEAAARGATWIKLYASFPEELFASTVRAAHARDMRVAIHPAPGGARRALDAGVDELEHLACLVPEGAEHRGTHGLNRWWAEHPEPSAWPVLPAGTRLCPTLVVQRRLLTHARNWEFPGAPVELATYWRKLTVARHPWNDAELDLGRRAESAMTGAVRRLAASGVRLVLGSDTPNPGVLPGASLWEEMNLLISAGLSPVTVYHAASVTGRGLGATGTEPLAFLPNELAADYRDGRAHPVTTIPATLLRGHLFRTRTVDEEDTGR